MYNDPFKHVENVMETLHTSGAKARAAGASKYFTGKPCLKGHIANRYAHSGQCVACGNAVNAAKRSTLKGKQTARSYYEKFREEKPHLIMFYSARNRAKNRKVAFSITAEDILRAWPEDNVCPILGLKMFHNFNRKGSHADASPSLDCIDPKKGYVIGNVVVCCFLANRIKNNVTDPAVFRKIANWIETNHKPSRRIKGN